MSTQFRTATLGDLPTIVAMLADDPLGATRETPDTPLAAHYVNAFEAIDIDPRQFLIVGEDEHGVNATCQLTFIPGLSRKGSVRVIIEAVRVASRCRGQGIGEQLIEHAIEQAKMAGANLVQLTTDKSRTDAHRFYERLGFVQSHYGYKLNIG